MTNIKNKFTNRKDKIVGTVKNKVGQVTGNETMELKGKIQSTKSDLKRMINKDDMGKKLDEIKEDIFN